MSTVAVAEAHRSLLRRFALAHPIAAFLTITFLIAYPLMTLVALAVHGVIPGGSLLDRLPVPPDEAAGLLLTLGGLLPAALYVTWAADGRSGLINLGRRITHWRFGLRWWLVILTALPVLTIALGLLLGDSLRSVDPFGMLLRQLPLLLVNLLLINLWEETAWAGVMQTRLERRHSLVLAALLTAVPFGFAHWPLAFLEPTATPASVLAALPGYVLYGLLFRPLLGVTLRATGNSLLAVALMHSTLNRTQNPDGIAASLLSGEGYRFGVLVVLLVLTGFLALLLRGKLSRNYRRWLDGRYPHDDVIAQPGERPA